MLNVFGQAKSDFAADPRSLAPANLRKQYGKFLETHVKSKVTDGILQLVDSKDVLAFLDNKAKSIPGVKLDDLDRVVLKDQALAIKDFVAKTGAKKLCFTLENEAANVKGGAWYVPPKLRPAFPIYMQSLLKQHEKNAPAMATIMLAQNIPIPNFELNKATGKMEQVGGFEAGDYHSFLVINDLRTGKNVEDQPTFMENSLVEDYRPKITGINIPLMKQLGLTRQQFIDRIKDPNWELDTTGMLSGERVAYVAYQNELTRDINRAANWDANLAGSNFNYIPMLGLTFGLTRQQHAVLLLDRELGGREGEIKAHKKSPTQDPNAEGFIPQTRVGFYPDRTPRYIRVVKHADGETDFFNATAPDDGKLPPNEKIIRAREYILRVEDKYHQVVKPYNHFGGTTGGFDGTLNCLGAMGVLLDGVAGSGAVGVPVLEMLAGHAGYRINGLSTCVADMVVNNKDTRKTVSINAPVNGKVDVYSVPLATGQKMMVSDFCNIPKLMQNLRAENAILFGSRKNPKVFKIKYAFDDGFENTGVKSYTVKAGSVVTAERNKVKADKFRPPNSQLTVFEVGRHGDILGQIHDAVASNPASRPALRNQGRQRGLQAA